MASDKPQSDILDLLYDDELDEETRAHVRRDVEQSDEAREELEGFESMLSRIRDVDLDEDVPESVHDSIMAAARKHAADNASRQAQVTKRAPADPKGRQSSLWSRLNSSGVSQLALAAAVVLVGGFVFLKLGGESADQRFSSAEHAVESEVTFGGGGGSSDKFAKAEPAPEQAEAAEEKYGQTAPGEEAGAEPVQPEADESTGVQKKSAVGELAKVDVPARANAPAPKKAKAKKSVAKRRTRKAASRKAAEDDRLEVLLDSKDSNRYAQAGRGGTEESQKERGNVIATGAENTPPSSSTGSSSKTGVSDGADLGSRLGSLADSTAEGEAAAADAAPSSASKPVPARQDERKQEQASSVSTMESNYQSGNYAGVVAEADRFLARSSSGSSDEARVLELKARALARQGKTSEAERTYAELQKKHPSYKPDQIRRERSDLAQKRRRSKARREAPAESVDLDEAVPEQQESPKMKMQPSSIDVTSE